MTREMVKQIERDYWAEKADPIDMAEVFDLVQKALEQEPVLDKIRAEIESKYGQCDICEYFEDYDPIGDIADILQIIDKHKAEQEPKTDSDCISRDAVLDVVSNPLNIRLEEIIKKLPPVNPQEPKTGRWIKISPGGIYECSECQQNVMTSDICAYKYCQGCGARMSEKKEDN